MCVYVYRVALPEARDSAGFASFDSSRSLLTLVGLCIAYRVALPESREMCMCVHTHTLCTYVYTHIVYICVSVYV